MDTLPIPDATSRRNSGATSNYFGDNESGKSTPSERSMDTALNEVNSLLHGTDDMRMSLRPSVESIAIYFYREGSSENHADPKISDVELRLEWKPYGIPIQDKATLRVILHKHYQRLPDYKDITKSQFEEAVDTALNSEFLPYWNRKAKAQLDEELAEMYGTVTSAQGDRTPEDKSGSKGVNEKPQP